MIELDRRAVLVGAGVDLAIAVPPLALYLASHTTEFEREASNWTIVVAVLAAFVAPAVGAVVAARRARRAPLVHGGGAALVASLVLTGTGTTANLVQGDDIHWLTILLVLQLTVSLGILGGWAAHRMSRPKASAP